MRVLHLGLPWLCPLAIPTLCLAMDPGVETVPETVKSITGKEIGGHLRFLASDLMRGRETATPEVRLAGEYLAGHLFASGAEPMGDRDDHGAS